jgi:hypothetical protein
MGFFEDLRQLKDVTTRQVEVAGGVYADPFNEIATIISVSDPKKLGRVKVSYQDGGTSDWIYVLNGSNKGLLSAQFIGSQCLIGKSDGNSEDAFVLGFFNKSPDAGYPGAASQIAVISEQVDANRAPSSPGDQGLRCNEGNEGRQYLFDNEMGGQTLRICKRINSRQEEGGPIWNWENLTTERVVEKGADPGVPTAQGTTDYGDKTGIPKCSKSLEGQIREFTEDRKFRSFPVKCGKDENGTYVWSPVSSTPVFFRTTLPACTEKLHGMDAILDEGLNSQGIKCLRYQGAMKWINPGKREPIQFHRQAPPPTREQFIDSRKPIEKLSGQSAAPASQDFVGKAGGAILDRFGKSIRPINSDPALRAAMIAANALPAAFNGTNLLTELAQIAIANNANISPAALSSQLATALAREGVIDDELAQILRALGGAGDVIARGVQNNTLDEALKIIGQNALRQSLGALSPELSGMYAAFGAGGALGAIDAAVAMGLNQVPTEVAQYISPILDIGLGILRSQPSSIGNVLNAAVGRGAQSLPQVIDGLVSVAGGQANLPPVITSAISGVLSGGGFGEIAQMFGNFSGLPGITSLGGVQGLPQLATTALGLVGLGEQFTSFLGPAGIGLNAFSELTGINPVSSILGGVPGIGGALGGLGGGGGECPCDPKCRKTEHSEDSDGNTLLEKCGNVIANSASSYNPDGDPTKNNENVVAKVLDLIPTGLGEKLCFPNPFDLTQLITTVKRLNEMADRIDSAKNADWPELWTELMYTFEAIENALKQADNNITGVESIERKLIDAQYRLLKKFMADSFSYFPAALKDIRENSQAIKDLYQFTLKLNGVKKGGSAGVRQTSAIGAAIKNIGDIPKLSAQSRAEANRVITEVIRPANKEWKDLEPGGELLNLADIILGAFNPPVPLNFDKCRTKRNKNKVLKDSLESKINSPVRPEPSSLFDAKLSEDAKKRLQEIQTDRPDIPTLLGQIQYEQGRAQSGEAEC